LSSRCETLIHRFVNEGKWIGPAPLLEQRVPDLRAEGSMHEGTATPHHALGTRARLSMPCRRALDKNPDAMRTRRETVEHPFGTLKMRMGATHF